MCECDKAGQVRLFFAQWNCPNDCVNFDVANLIIGVDMKFEKGLNSGCRDNFPPLLMTLSYHSLENKLSTQNPAAVHIFHYWHKAAKPLHAISSCGNISFGFPAFVLL